MTRTPEWSEIIDEHVRNVLAEARTAIPARVESYDASKQTINAQPMIKNFRVDDDGNQLLESVEAIPNVPVGFIRGGGYFVSLPLEKGDYVLLVACDSCIEQWRETGKESNPGDIRHHDLSDAVAIPGVYPDTKPLSEASSTKLVIGKDGGLQMRVDGSLIELGTTAGTLDFVALAQKVLGEFQKLQTHFGVIEGVLTGVAITEPGNGANSALQTALASAIGASPYPSPDSVAASKVKAE